MSFLKVLGAIVNPGAAALELGGRALGMTEDMRSVGHVLHGLGSGNPFEVADGIDGLRDVVSEGKFEFYGAYAGPKHGDLSKPRPTDPTQAAFYDHDKGYGENGYFDTKTDLRLMRDLGLLQLDPTLSLPDRLHGAAAIAIFSHVTPAVAVGRAAKAAWNGIKGLFD